MRRNQFLKVVIAGISLLLLTGCGADREASEQPQEVVEEWKEKGFAVSGMWSRSRNCGLWNIQSGVTRNLWTRCPLIIGRQPLRSEPMTGKFIVSMTTMI